MNIINYFRKQTSSNTGFFVFLLWICILAYGLLVDQLGFYWDDWPPVFLARNGSPESFLNFYSYDRPFSIWTFLLAFPILGIRPIYWQLFTLFLRSLVGLSYFLVIKELWPKQRSMALGAALLFVVYPSFTQQHISVAYSQHFLTYTLFLLSIWLMLRATYDAAHYFWLTLTAILISALQLFTLEYFVGLEFLRPLLLFLALFSTGTGRKAAARKAIKLYAPYMIPLFIFAAWRFLFLNIETDPNQLRILASLWEQPIQTLSSLLEHYIQDTVFVLFSSWFPTLQPELFSFSDRSSLFAFGVGLLAFASIFIYLKKQPSSKDLDSTWYRAAIWLGLAGVFFGMLPARITEREVLSGLFSNRFTIPAMFGAAIFWVGLINLFVQKHLHRILVIGILVGLAVGLQIRQANIYKQDWQKQSRIFWQLYWRAPDLQPHTGLIASGGLTAFVNDYSASAALNTLYNSSTDQAEVDYWVFDYFDDFNNTNTSWSENFPLDGQLRSLSFNGSSQDALFFHYSQNGQCVWILTESDINNKDVPIEIRTLARLSNLDRIQTTGNSNLAILEEIFGAEPEHNWCFYFEKMNLAKQENDWETVLDLWKESDEKGHKANNQFENIVIVEALGHKERWDEAWEFSRELLKREPAIKDMLCSLWTNWFSLSGPDESLIDEILEPDSRLACDFG